MTAAAWVVMGHHFWCRNTTRSLAEKFLWSPQTLMMCAYLTLCPLIFHPKFLCIFLASVFFLSFVCLVAFHQLSLCLCLNPYHTSTSLFLSLCLSQSPPHGYAHLRQACVLAQMSWRACLRVIGVFTDVGHRAYYLQRMNWVYPPWRQKTWHGNKEENRFICTVRHCCIHCRIHNWWSFAALLHWPTPVVQNVGTWAPRALNLCPWIDLRGRYNRDMRRASDNLRENTYS